MQQMGVGAVFGTAAYSTTLGVLDRTKGGAGLSTMTDAHFNRINAQQYVSSANSDMASMLAKALGYADLRGMNVGQVQQQLEQRMLAGMNGAQAIESIFGRGSLAAVNAQGMGSQVY